MTKRKEIVNVHKTAGKVDEPIALDRRKFFKFCERAGLAVLTVQILPLITHASGMFPTESRDAADNFIIHSGPGAFGHVHDLLIPYGLLKTPPPQGVTLTSTEALFHTHAVALSREQLASVNRGGTVTKKASSHVFVIALANREHDSH